MAAKFRGFLWLLFFLFLGFDLYAWGGLAITPVVGTQLREQASLRSPLAAPYLYAGRKSVDLLGIEHAAVAFAANLRSWAFIVAAEYDLQSESAADRSAGSCLETGTSVRNALRNR